MNDAILTYTEAQTYVARLLKKHYSILDSKDIVHELIAEAAPLSRKYLKRCFFKYFDDFNAYHNLDPNTIYDANAIDKRHRNKAKVRLCRLCLDEKPINCFYKLHKSGNDQKRLYICNECSYKKNREYIQKVKHTSGWKLKRRIYDRKYRHLHRDKKIGWRRKQSRKEISTLSDNYIKQVIRMRLHIPRELITPALMTEQRERILLYRAKLKK